MSDVAAVALVGLGIPDSSVLPVERTEEFLGLLDQK
jgi:hypothetical protein